MQKCSYEKMSAWTFHQNALRASSKNMWKKDGKKNTNMYDINLKNKKNTFRYFFCDS